MALWRDKSGGSWEQWLLKAVSEVLSHPLGGRVDIIVYSQEKPGDRRVVILPSMGGVTKKTIELTMDGD